MRQLRSRRLLTAAVLVSALVATACGTSASPDAAGGDRNLTIGAGPTGSAYFLLGGAIGQLIEEDFPDAEVSVSAGDVAAFIREGKDLSFGQPDLGECAWTGSACQGFQPGEQFPDVRFVAVGYVNPFIMLTTADSPLNRVSDITSSDILGISGATTVDVYRDLLSYTGLTDPNLQVVPGYDAALNALRNGQVAVVPIGSAHPIAAIEEAARAFPLKVLEYDDTALDQLVQEYPYSRVTVPAGTYEFMDRDLEAWGRSVVLMADASVPDDVVTELTRSIYEQTDVLTAVVPPAVEFTLENVQSNFDGNVIRFPVHPGARAYYEESGISIPDSVPAA